MTTKSEFDAFVRGFKLAYHDFTTMDRVQVILDMIPEVVASEIAADSSVEVTGPIIDGEFALKAGRDQVKRDKIDALIEELKAVGASFPKTSGMLVLADQLDSVIQQCEDMLAAQPKQSDKATVAGPEFPSATDLVAPAPSALPDDRTAI